MSGTLGLRAPAPLHPAASGRLDLLRLLLIAQVMLGHYAMIAFPPFPALELGRPADIYVAGFRLLTRFGGEAAFVFVCISGFLLAPRLLATALGQPGAEPVSAFLFARLRRIYPTLIAAIALTALCDWIALTRLGAEPLYRTAMTYDAGAAFNWVAALGNALSLQPTFAGAFGSNGPLWTLGYIVQFYCTAALLAASLRRAWPLAAGLGIAIVVAGLVWRPEWSLLFLCWLGCGAMRWFPAHTSIQGIVLAAAGLVLFVLANLAPDPVAVIPAGLAGAAWLGAVLAPSVGQSAASRPATLARLSEASFALYAFHFPLAMLLLASIAPHADLSGLAFRLLWPLLAAAPAIAIAIGWHAALPHLMRGSQR